MMFRRSGDTALQQLLAVGDEHGNLHILDIPRNLRRPVNNESSVMVAYIEREVQRVNYISQRVSQRSTIPPPPVKHEEHELKVEDGNGEESEANAAEAREDEILETQYRRMEAEFRSKFNIYDASSVSDNTSPEHKSKD
jgi:hypothetical protein